jgi:hypothetical protein
MDALFAAFPIALAIGLAWLMFAKWREAEDTDNNDLYFTAEDEPGDEDE